MKTPKKRITLKTPKRTAKSTFKTKEYKKPKENIKNKKPDREEESELAESSYKFLRDLDVEIKNSEKDLIASLQKENDFLRNTNLYIKFLGLDITQIGDKYVIKYKVSKDNRFLQFELIPDEDMYIYSLIKSENLNELGILGDEISFEKEQVTKFFYKVMEIMISD